MQSWMSGCKSPGCLQDQMAALKFFQRALQLDPAFTYAYTLSGHENLALEQFDKSLTCFRNAMRLDPRHYNAWYITSNTCSIAACEIDSLKKRFTSPLFKTSIFYVSLAWFQPSPATFALAYCINVSSLQVWHRPDLLSSREV